MKVGSLCTGIGGLDLAVGGDLRWVAEIDKNPSKVLAHRFPDVPNLGDWTGDALLDAEPVDLIVGGLPCQPVSTAGQRAGTTDERWLFDDLTDVLGRMGTRPDLFLENVPGLLTANGGNAMARIVHGLAGLGYVGRWRTVRASDVGACHRRARWFLHASHADGIVGEWSVPVRSGGRRSEEAARNGRSTASYPDFSGGEARGDDRQERERVRVQPVGSATSAFDADSVSTGGNSREVFGAEEQGWRQPNRPHGFEVRDHGRSFGKFSEAVDRWEHVLGRTAPDPVTEGRLNPVFVEWMMGYPAGWVSDILSRSPALKALGNAVVPQQARLAYEVLTCR